jgi:hypothetical protein
MKKILLIFFLYTQNILLYGDTIDNKTDYLNSFLSLRDEISQKYYNLLKRLDNALCANEDLNNTKLEKIIYKNNLQLVVSFKNYQKINLIPRLYIRANFILPKTYKRFEFTLDKQTNSKLLNQKLDTRHSSNNLKDEKLRLGLKYNLVKDNYFNFYTKLSTQINHPTNIYAKIGAVKYLNFQSFMIFWNAQLYQYILNSKFIASSSINFIKPLNDQLTFEKDFILTWERVEKTTSFDFIAKLHHEIDKKNALEYWLSYKATYNTLCHYCPNEYATHIKYRHALKRWAYIDLSPQLTKRKENHFSLEYAIRLNFILIFSK